MRIVSLVPSWTETLVEIGLQPVGRTRYCIHPAPKVASIPIVGGTKDVDWETVAALKPNLLLADREENRRDILERAPCPVFVSHVTDIASLIEDLSRLETWLSSRTDRGTGLRGLRTRWQIQAGKTRRIDISDLPATKRWLMKPEQQVERILYMVWREPWIAVSRDSFIGSMFGALGLGTLFPDLPQRYSAVEIREVAGPSTLFLFASEPYPFARPGAVPDDFAPQSPRAIIDGEAYAWYGIRSLRLLESLK